MTATSTRTLAIVALMCGICALAAGSTLAQTYTITHVTAPTGSGVPISPRAGSIALADFNGDTQLDVAVAGTSVSGVAVFRSGSIATNWVPAGRWPIALAAADFDADGDIDLASANRNEGGVAILTNDGTGQFTRTAFYATGSVPFALVAADMDKDDAMDLVVANRTSGTVVVLGNTAGVFSVRQTIPLPLAIPGAPANVSCEPNDLVAVDLDSDTLPDVAVTCAADDTVKILTSTSGTLALTGTYVAGWYPLGISTGDFNGDGRLELAVASGEASQVTLLQSDLLGGYTVQDVSLVTAPYTWPTAIDVQAVDVDADGDFDLLAAGLTLLNDGQGAFTVAPTTSLQGSVYTAAPTPAGLAVAAYRPGTIELKQFAAPAGSTADPADINGDGVVNVFDLQVLAASWNKSAGQQGFDPRADIDGNGTVNVFDLMALAVRFGQRVR